MSLSCTVRRGLVVVVGLVDVVDNRCLPSARPPRASTAGVRTGVDGGFGPGASFTPDGTIPSEPSDMPILSTGLSPPCAHRVTVSCVALLRLTTAAPAT